MAKFKKLSKESITEEQKQWFLEAQQRAKEIGSKYGYEIDCTKANPVTKEKPIQTIWAIGKKYYPSFMINTFATIFDKEVGAKIQTTAFGSMSTIDYEELLEIYHKALACAKELEKEFIYKE